MHWANLLANNRRRKREWEKALDFRHGYHEQTTPARYRLSHEQYLRNWGADESMDVCLL